MSRKKKSKKTIVAVSGGFDPVHIGHVRLFQKARKLGHRLVVILNNDNWLMNKKGFVFMKQNERKEILLALDCVDSVVITSHTKHDPDTSVCRALAKIKPDIFANGGDRKRGNVPEDAVCSQLGIKMVYNVGGGKVQSSSWLTAKVKEQ